MYKTGNTFTGTTKLEFNDAQATTWADNAVPNDSVSCFSNISGVDDDGADIPTSTFTPSRRLAVQDFNSCE